MSPFAPLSKGRLPKVIPAMPSLSSSESNAVSASGSARGDSSGAGFRNSPVLTFAVGQGASASSSPSADGTSKWLWIGAAIVAAAVGFYLWNRNRK